MVSGVAAKISGSRSTGTLAGLIVRKLPARDMLHAIAAAIGTSNWHRNHSFGFALAAMIPNTRGDSVSRSPRASNPGEYDQ